MARVPVNPTPTTPTPSPTAPSTSPDDNGPNNGGPSGPSGGGDGISGAERRAIARENEAKRKAAKRYADKARQLQQQANALKIALGKNGYRSTLRQQLENVSLVFRSANELYLDQYRRGRTELERQSETNTQARERALTDALTNSGRERTEAIAQATAHGVGASDMLKAQQASLRNWQFNANAAQQDYVDTQNSLMSSNAELVNTVVANRESAFRGAEADREQYYRTYYDNKGEALRGIGDMLGEASSYWDMSNEQKGSKKAKRMARRLGNDATDYYERQARQTGKAYEQRATPRRIKDWTGRPPPKGQLGMGPQVRQELVTEEAEGATLRRWEG